MDRLRVALKGHYVGNRLRHAFLEALRLFVTQAVNVRFNLGNRCRTQVRSDRLGRYLGLSFRNSLGVLLINV